MKNSEHTVKAVRSDWLIPVQSGFIRKFWGAGLPDLLITVLGNWAPLNIHTDDIYPSVFISFIYPSLLYAAGKRRGCYYGS